MNVRFALQLIYINIKTTHFSERTSWSVWYRLLCEEPLPWAKQETEKSQADKHFLLYTYSVLCTGIVMVKQNKKIIYRSVSNNHSICLFKINAILLNNRQLYCIKKLFKIKKFPDTDERFSCFIMNRTQPWSLIKRLKQYFIWLQYCRNKRIRKKRRNTLESKWQTCNFGSLTFVDKHVLYALTIWKRLLFRTVPIGSNFPILDSSPKEKKYESIEGEN